MTRRTIAAVAVSDFCSGPSRSPQPLVRCGNAMPVAGV
jgi:hypothetical protein